MLANLSGPNVPNNGVVGILVFLKCHLTIVPYLGFKRFDGLVLVIKVKLLEYGLPYCIFEVFCFHVSVTNKCILADYAAILRGLPALLVRSPGISPLQNTRVLGLLFIRMDCSGFVIY